jgi:hypothetical protein
VAKSATTATEVMLKHQEMIRIFAFSEAKMRYLSMMFMMFGVEPITEKEYKIISESLKNWEYFIISMIKEENKNEKEGGKKEGRKKRSKN